MSQILVKQDPLVDFIPQWTEITENSFDESGFNTRKFEHLEAQSDLNYINHAKCFVGEARGFNDDYMKHDTECRVCMRMSHGVLCGIADHGLRWFYNYKQELYDHIQSCHKK